MSIKILVTGDLHLGKHSSALPDDGMAGSTKHTWLKITNYAIENQIDVVCLTGDIIDQDNKYFEAFGAFRDGLHRLNENAISVYMVSGNHDWNVLPRLVKEEHYTSVFLLGKEGFWEAKDYRKEEEAIRFIGWSFPTNYVELSPVHGLGKELTDTDIPCIGLVHADVLSAESRYAPVSPHELTNRNDIDAWCLGHIHKSQSIHNKKPLVFYPGSPHALSPKEQGVKGFYILTVEGHNVESNYIPFSPVYYDTITLNISDVADQNSFREKTASELSAHWYRVNEQFDPAYIILDLHITGECRDIIEPEQWSKEIPKTTHEPEQTRSIRRIKFDLQPLVDLEAWTDEPGYIGLLANALSALQRDKRNDLVDRMIEEWKTAYEQMAVSTAYAPLEKKRLSDDWQKEAKTAVADACKRLISELIKQKENAD